MTTGQTQTPATHTKMMNDYWTDLVNYKKKMTFKNFMTDVDTNVQVRCGLSIHDLPDVDFHSFWWEGIDEADWQNMVEGAASEALTAAGGEGII